MSIFERGAIMAENIDIRCQVVKDRLHYKDIAKQIGVTPEYLSRCMRHPLKPDMYARVVTAIYELRGSGDNGKTAGDHPVSV